MDTRKCQVLLKVLECGSMAGAASQFGYDPSGISRMIASMERETGFALLVRSKNGISLTKGGERLLPVIQELAHFGSVYEKAASQILGVEEGSVLIGSAFYGLYPWLTRVIAGFSAKYPKVDIRIMDSYSTRLVSDLAEHKVDIAVISEREGDFRWIPLLEDELVAVLPHGHRLAEMEAVPAEELEKEPFIEFLPGEVSDTSLYFEQAGVTPHSQYCQNDIFASCALVEAGLGVTVDNAVLVKTTNADVVMRPLVPRCVVPIGLALPKRTEMSPAAIRFEEYVLSHLEGLEALGTSFSSF